jgi:hypothetical protein
MRSHARRWIAMAKSWTHRAVAWTRSSSLSLLAVCLFAYAANAWADEFDDEFPSIVPDRSVSAATPLSSAPRRHSHDPSEVLAPDAAEFGEWEPLVERESTVLSAEPDKPPLRPFDWMRHWGFHHSSTEGPFLFDKGVPLQGTSWLNRPYYASGFVGPLLVDGPEGDRVAGSNAIFGGFRLGWDFDYYWGMQARIGWSDPNISAVGLDEEISGEYLVGDIDFVYYPWGDTKVRPYFLAGIGLTQVDTVRENNLLVEEVTLLSTPFGIGVQFPQTHWLAWRLEIIDNLAFGGDGVDTMNNFAFTAGLELRMGARPNSYWPWRSSRVSW